MADAVALALTSETRHGQMEPGLGWIRSPISAQRSIWWHNGATHGSRAFTAFDPDTRTAVAAATNCSQAPDAAARRALSRVTFAPKQTQPT
jgi:CubicO group peptidase (beta-lactamase class C family)